MHVLGLEKFFLDSMGKVGLRLWGMIDGGVHMESTVTLIWASLFL